VYADGNAGMAIFARGASAGRENVSSMVAKRSVMEEHVK
jgi:hypothetical protein